MALSDAMSTAQLAGWIDTPTRHHAVRHGSANRIPAGRRGGGPSRIWPTFSECGGGRCCRCWPLSRSPDACGATLALAVGLGVLAWKRPTSLIGGLLLANLALLAHRGIDSVRSPLCSSGVPSGMKPRQAYRCSATVSGLFGGVPHALQLDNTTPQHALNDALELLWETGVIGFCLAHRSFMRQLFGPLNASRLVLIVFAGRGAFDFRPIFPLRPLSRWGGCRVMLFHGIGLWYAGSLAAGEILVIRGAWRAKLRQG